MEVRVALNCPVRSAHRTRGRSPGSFAANCWPLRMTLSF